MEIVFQPKRFLWYSRFPCHTLVTSIRCFEYQLTIFNLQITNCEFIFSTLTSDIGHIRVVHSISLCQNFCLIFSEIIQKCLTWNWPRLITKCRSELFPKL